MATALLERIAAFRQKLDAMDTLTLEPPPAVIAPPVVQAPVLTSRAQQLLLAARDLIANQKQLQVASNDPLASYHRSTVGLTESALRLAQQLPAESVAQDTACDGLEHLLKVIAQRNHSLQNALQFRATDQRRVQGLANILTALQTGRAMTLNPLVDLAKELLEDARTSTRLRLLCPLDSESVVNAIATHAVNVAGIVARLLPHDYEWAAKPILPVLAALVMDVGMLSVPAEVIFARRPLTSDERRRVELHPRESSDLVRKCLPDGGPLADIVLAHHERPDGSGYPNGLRGETITVLARFLSAADTYAALATSRPHREAMDTRSALGEVLALAEQGKLDRDFAEYHLNLSFHPIGTVVELVDGRIAVVATTHAKARPMVSVLTDVDGQVKVRPEIVDLATADRGGILRSIPKSESRAKLAEWYPELCI